MPKKTVITDVITEGDSLSDRGTMYRRWLLWFIPMKWLSGLSGRSPLGRFTNAHTWDDHLSAMFANEFTIQEAKRTGFKNRPYLDSADVADAVLSHDLRIKKHIHHAVAKDTNQSVLGIQHVRGVSQNQKKAPKSILVFCKLLFVRNLKGTAQIPCGDRVHL